MLIAWGFRLRGNRTAPPARGFTLVELMVTLAVLAVLLMLAAPSFTEMIRNSQVRSVTDALQNGLRAAQNEALRRNRQVVFTLTNDTPGANSGANENGRNWAIHSISRVTEAAGIEYVQGGQLASTADNVTITGPAAICFNAMGRLVANDTPGVTDAVCTLDADALPSYQVTIAGATRPLQVNVALGGQLRMCDPAKVLSATAPDGCPQPPQNTDDDDPPEAPDPGSPTAPESQDNP